MVAVVPPLVADSDEDDVDSPVADAGVLFDVGLFDAEGSLAAEVGGTNAAGGGVGTLVLAGLDVDGARLVGLCVADVIGAGATRLGVADVTGAGALDDDGATRCAGGAALVTAEDGASRVGATTGVGVGVEDAGSGALVCDGASTVCCTVGATISGDGATGGDGTAATVGISTCGGVVSSMVGCGTAVVVVTTGGELGSAKAGATPPVSAVRDTTTPDARTAQTVRLRQI